MAGTTASQATVYSVLLFATDILCFNYIYYLYIIYLKYTGRLTNIIIILELLYYRYNITAQYNYDVTDIGTRAPSIACLNDLHLPISIHLEELPSGNTCYYMYGVLKSEAAKRV